MHSEVIHYANLARKELESIKGDTRKIEDVNLQLKKTLIRYHSCNLLCEQKARRVGAKFKSFKKKSKPPTKK